MGTRHLIAVQLNGEYKIAQYGQWDGYPEGQGLDVVKFLRGANLEKFRENVASASFLTEEELKSKQESDLGMFQQLSRDTGAKILQIVHDNSGVRLYNSIDFAGDSLFCEWAYVIDLDKNTFEVFKGFNQEPLKESDRFFGFKAEGDYHPVKLVKSWPLDEFPMEGVFLKTFSNEEEE